MKNGALTTESSGKNAEIITTQNDSLEKMRTIEDTTRDIRNQNPIQALFLGSKNERALAKNDELFADIIKGMLNWLMMITSADLLRKDEYDRVTAQLLRIDENVIAQEQLQIKLKEAYQITMQRQQEHQALKKTVRALKRRSIFFAIISLLAFGLGGAALAIVLLL